MVNRMEQKYSGTLMFLPEETRGHWCEMGEFGHINTDS